MPPTDLLPGLTEAECRLLCSVFQRHPQARRVVLFGSRAMGTHRPNSDVDLAAWGRIDDMLAARILAELDDLPLPYLFDFKRFETLTHAELREHILTKGLDIYSRAV